MSKIIIETKDLILREYVPEDFEKLKEILSDPETMKYYPKPYSDDGVRRWIQWNLDNYENLGFGLWAIELKSTGQLIGDCGITMQIIDKKILPEIGYHIHKDYWQKGYGSEAAIACKDWIFTHTPFKIVYSYMNANNVASYRLAMHNGMSLVKEYNDGTEDLKVFAITREQWEKQKH